MTEQTRKRSRLLLLWLTAALILGGCGERQAGQMREPQEAAAQEEGEKEPVIGLILTSVDAKENEAVTAAFEEAAKAAGARLIVRAPEVKEADAEQAAGITGDFVLCQVDPIELQMLLVNEMVAENVDVIAIHANHSLALTSVLSAARGVGIQVCAFGRDVGEESCDLYADTKEAPQEAVRLLGEEN